MSYALVFGAVLAAVAFGGFIGGLFWWVRRPISSRRLPSTVLPLFGHDRAVVYARAEDDGEDEDERAQLIMARAPTLAPTLAPTPAPAGRGSVDTNGTAHAAAHAAERAAPNTARMASPSWSTPVTRTVTRIGYAPLAGVPISEVPAANASAFAGESIRYSVPTDSTLQFLPGRLEIIGGPDLGRDIRFVRTPGRDAIEVTFGRNEGPPYRHVQLHDATVSRAHACMRYRDGRWLLSNLSATNPVLHNGGIVGLDEQRPLDEGDRIDMGEVVFRFHV